MSEWIEMKVGDLVAGVRNALVGGPFGSNLVSKDYVPEGVPVIRGTNMGSRWVGGEFAYVTPEKAQSLLANTARPGDIVFTQRARWAKWRLFLSSHSRLTSFRRVR